jgi:hypothetical protein
MKAFTLIVLLFGLGCSGKKKYQGSSYDSLGAAIVDGFLTKGNRSQPVLILVTNDKNSNYYHIKPSVVFKETIQAVFKTPDTTALKTLVENNPLLDTTAKIAALHVRYVTRIPPEGYDWRKLEMERISKDLLIVNFFLMLTTKDGNTCVVYAHKIKKGSEIVVLEKNNNKWYITSIQRDHPEVIED